jgi:diguanylate cyclase (GGDEF)-like protein
MQEVIDQLVALQAESEALIAVYDPDDCLAYGNSKFRSTFFIEPNERLSWSEIMRRNYYLQRGTRIDASDFEAWLTSTVSRRSKLAHRAFESHLTGGQCLWIVETTLANGWGLFIGTDITELRTDETGLRKDRDTAVKAAQTDELTGISNRRHIMSLLEALMSGQTSTRSRSGCVCVLDIDHFKRLNDHYGHIVGDEVLKGVAQIVRTNIRLKDMFGRVGGEEFLLVMPDCSIKDAERTLARILNLIRQSSPSRIHPALRLTCSAGVTDIRPCDDIKTVYKRADESLYAAKQNGRDKLMIAQS